MALVEKFKKDLLKANLAYLILICIIYFPIVFCGKTLSAAARYPWFKQSVPAKVSVVPVMHPSTFNVDLASPAAFEEPIDYFVGGQLKKGVFPMWNPFIACGTVVQEQFSTRSLFFYQLLQNFCPVRWSDFFLLGRIFFAAIGVFIFLKIFGLKFYSAFCGGLAYGFGGAMTVFLTLTQMSNVGMVLPYALIGSELLSLKQGLPQLIFYSIAVALLVMAGQPEISFYALLFIISYAVFRMVTIQDEGRGGGIKKIRFLFFGTGIALLIASPFFIPFLATHSQYYHLHPYGGTQGIETATPLVNFWAIFMPELLRWRSELTTVTINAGWDCLGGYVGITSTIFIIMAFTKRWWGYRAYLFFLGWAVLILFKNMGVPVVSWIGKLPIFDQVWTPRWTGVIWNLSWALAAALGLEALSCRFGENSGYVFSASQANKKSVFLIKIFLAIFIILLASLSFIMAMVNPGSISSLRLFIPWFSFMIVLSSVGLFVYLRGNKISWLFLLLALGIAGGVLNFELQLWHIDGSFKQLTQVQNKLVLFSMHQGILSSAVLGLGILLVFARGLKNRSADQEKFILMLVGAMVIETMFHVTLGYDEAVRFGRLVLYSAGLFYLAFYPVFLNPQKSKVELKYALCLFIAAAILIRFLGLAALPDRRNVFAQAPDYLSSDAGGLNRIMGMRGLIFPNASAAFGIQDVRSVESISLKRFQLFKDHCLLAQPQPKQQSLWFTGVIDSSSRIDIAENIRQRHHFYDLAGVSNYFSPQYELLPRTKLINDGMIKNYQNLAVMPRAFVVYDWKKVSSAQKALAWLSQNGPLLRSEAVVEGGAGIPEPARRSPDLTLAKIKAHNLHSVIVEAQANEPGLLILTDAYHSNWRVTVDGKPGKIFPADLCFRGVFLSPGKHEVKFIYSPQVFYICIGVSALTFLILFLSIFYLVIKRKIIKTGAGTK